MQIDNTNTIFTLHSTENGIQKATKVKTMQKQKSSCVQNFGLNSVVIIISAQTIHHHNIIIQIKNLSENSTDILSLGKYQSNSAHNHTQHSPSLLLLVSFQPMKQPSSYIIPVLYIRCCGFFRHRVFALGKGRFVFTSLFHFLGSLQAQSSPFSAIHIPCKDKKKKKRIQSRIFTQETIIYKPL